MRFGWLNLLTLALSLGAALSWNAEAEAAPRGKVLRHIVLYQFKADQSAARIQEVVDTFCALPKKIDVILAFEHGTNVSQEQKSEGFTHIFVVTFRDEAALQTYLRHPAHEHYVSVVKDRREKVIVFDFWVDE